MRIKTSKQNIDGAVRGNSRHCMIADAIAEQVPNAKQVIVDAQSIRWTDKEKGVRYTFMTPPEAQKQLIRFDAGKVVEPFVVEIGEPVLVKSVHVDNNGKRHKTREQKRKASAKTSRQVREAQIELGKRRYATAKREFGLRVFDENKGASK